VVTRIADSVLHGHLWSTGELRSLFDERSRISSWLDILVALARAQTDVGLMPVGVADQIAAHARIELLDLEWIGAETRQSGHSTLGLIRGLQEILPAEAREWVYYGATVQDLTDTWTALATKAVGAVLWRDLRAIEGLLLDLAERHRETPMAGRTHGQPGAPITFGYKAAGWADEVRRHLYRLREGSTRWLVGQLGGGVGTLAFFGERGLELRQRFCARLGLADPGIAWLSSRDRVAEFVGLLGLIAATTGRIGNEIFELQRPEISELREPADPGTVGSITMPHKRNPERSEHLVTLARLVRASAAVVLEGAVHEHERDGRAWKGEWVAFPEACLLTGTALAMALDILAGLEVDAEAMRRNLSAEVYSEKVLRVLAAELGKHRAQALMHEALVLGREQRLSLEQSLEASEELRRYVDPEALQRILASVDAGAAPQMVDHVVARGRRERAQEPDEWP
jgi:adenylosuccinate lyase